MRVYVPGQAPKDMTDEEFFKAGFGKPEDKKAFLDQIKQHTSDVKASTQVPGATVNGRNVAGYDPTGGGGGFMGALEDAFMGKGGKQRKFADITQSVGLQGGDQRTNLYQQLFNQAAGRAPYQVNEAPQEQFRNQQTALSNQLMAQATGQAPSLANLQLQQGMQANLKNQLAQAASARGNINPAMLQRQLMQNQAVSGQNLAQQAAINRMQEQLSAQQQLAGVAQSGRAQDIGLGTTQANLQLQSQAQRAAEQQAALAGQTQQAALLQQADLASQGLRAEEGIKDLYGASAGAQTASGIGQAAAGIGNLLSKATPAAAPAAAAPAVAAEAASDENEKNVKGSAEHDVAKFFEAIGAHKYTYKHPDKKGQKGGMNISPMAQELERTAMGNSMVEDTPNGKMVDYGHGLGAILAAQKVLYDKVKKLEEAKKKRK